MVIGPETAIDENVRSAETVTICVTFQVDCVKKSNVVSVLTVSEFTAMLRATVTPRGGMAERLTGIIAVELAPPSVIVNVAEPDEMRILAGVVSIDIKTTLAGVDMIQVYTSNDVS